MDTIDNFAGDGVDGDDDDDDDGLKVRNFWRIILTDVASISSAKVDNE